MGKYRYPPDFIETTDEDGNPAWRITEIMQDGEIKTQTFSDRDEALEELEKLRSEENPPEEDLPPPAEPVDATAVDPAVDAAAEPVEAVAVDPAVEGNPDGT